MDTEKVEKQELLANPEDSGPTLKERLYKISYALFPLMLLIIYFLYIQLNYFKDQYGLKSLGGNDVSSEMTKNLDSEFTSFMQKYHKEEYDGWLTEGKTLYPSHSYSQISNGESQEMLWAFGVPNSTNDSAEGMPKDFYKDLYVATQNYIVNLNTSTGDQYSEVDGVQIFAPNSFLDENDKHFFGVFCFCMGGTKLFNYDDGSPIKFSDPNHILKSEIYKDIFREDNTLAQVAFTDISLMHGAGSEEGWIIETNFGYAMNLGKVFFNENGQVVGQVSLHQKN